MLKLNKTLQIAFFCVLLSIPGLSEAQTWQDTVGMIEKLFERYKPGNPGCQVAVSRQGQVIYSRAWGMANLEHNVPLTTQSVLEAGSVSKQFTAAAILLLEQQGKLSLGDDVRKYIPELPDYGTPITLRHMMQHTSGLKDWGSIAALSGWPRSSKTYNNDHALYIASKQKTLNHKPGAEYIYSNSNYNLFAVIVERVSGMSLAEFTRVHIFEPAGMKHTQWRDDFKRVVPNRGIAYAKRGNAYFTEMPNEYVYGNGGLLTTAEDLLIWNNYFLNGKLGNPSLLPNQLARTPLNNGAVNRYAAGLVIDSMRGWKVILHDGATTSYRANLMHFPELGLSIAWLSNTSEFDGSQDGASAVRNLLVKDKSVPVKRPEPKTVEVPLETLNTYTGWYRDERTANSVKLFIRNGKLESSRSANMVPIAANVFSLGQNRVEIQTGKPKKLWLISPSDTTVFIETDSVALDEKLMNEYVGRYWSDEAEAALQVQVKDGKLIIHREPGTDYPLVPAYRDGFNAPGMGVYFERDKKGHVATMKFFVGRARNVAFNKVIK